MRVHPLPWLAVVGAAALIVAQQPWWTGPPGADPAGTSASGSTGVAGALALAALGGVLLAWALRPPGRRVVGLLLVALHLAMALVGALSRAPDGVGATATVWPWAYAGAGVLGAAAAALLAIRPGVGRPVGERVGRVALDDSLANWKAMDAGVDPTATEPEREESP